MLGSKCSIWRKFSQDASGAVALMFGLIAIPLLLAAGVAFDFAILMRIEAKLQTSIDAAALSAASIKNADDATRKATAEAYLATNLAGQNIGTIGTPVVTVNEKSITVSINSDVDMNFMRLVGYLQHGLSAEATVVLPGVKNAEVVLVLDYSRSMDRDGKYQAMRDAATNMVNGLTDNGMSTDSVKFGLVPFSHHVYLSLPGEYVVDETAGTTWTNCTQDRKYPYNVEDSPPDSTNIDTLWGMSPTNGYANSAYNECNQYANKNLFVMPLTNDANAVKAQLQSMTPHHKTHIALGAEFGWALLSPGAPFTEGVPYTDDETRKYLVILTDGVQTQKAWGQNQSHTVPNGETNLEELCTNIKSEGINVITIAFDLNDTWTEQRLKDCATTVSDFHIADGNADLANVFEQITAKLEEMVRISE